MDGNSGGKVESAPVYIYRLEEVFLNTNNAQIMSYSSALSALLRDAYNEELEATGLEDYTINVGSTVVSWDPHRDRLIVAYGKKIERSSDKNEAQFLRGFIAYKWHGEEFEISALAVPHQYRGMNIGRDLVLSALVVIQSELQAHNQAVKQVDRLSEVTVVLDCKPALKEKFYASLGFEQCGPENNGLIRMKRVIKADEALTAVLLQETLCHPLRNTLKSSEVPPALTT